MSNALVQSVPSDAVAATAAPPLSHESESRVLETLEALHARVDELARREREQQTIIGRLEDQLRNAGAMQRAFLPDRVPDIEGLDVRVVYRPLEHVSGDVYDVRRLDETHVAFTIADATGHGLPAALLSALVRRSFQGTETVGHGGRVLDPDEVLRRVNSDLVGAELKECEFIAAIHAVYNESTGIVRWARGGVPYPILLRPGQPAMAIRSEGPLIGACEAATFEVVELRLLAGDQLVFFTDGAEEVLSQLTTPRENGEVNGLTPARSGAGEAISRLDEALATAQAAPEDDVTALVLHASPRRDRRFAVGSVGGPIEARA